MFNESECQLLLYVPYHLTGNDSVLVDQFHTRASYCSRVTSSSHTLQLVELLQPASGPGTEEMSPIVIDIPIILHVVAALEEGDQVHVHHHWLLLVTRGGAECQVQHSSFIVNKVTRKFYTNFIPILL